MTESPEGEVRVPADADLALPRPPGVIRRFWARHPLLSDILIALLCLVLSFAGASVGAVQAAWGLSLAILLLVLAGSTALVFRRRMPLLAFALAIALQLTLPFAPHGGAAPLLVVSTYSLAVYGSTRRCTTAGIGGTLLVTLVAGIVAGVTHTDSALGETLNTFFTTGLSVLLGALVGVNVGNRKRYLNAVLDRSRQLAVERDQQAELAAAAERERIAREMHDIVSHSLTVIVALAEGAGATPDPERARTAMTAAATTARSALTDMRAMLGVLRSDDPDAPLAPLQALSPADVVASAQEAGMPVTLTTAGPADLPPATAYAVGRIVQEGLTNAMRHAPTARGIRVRIDTTAARVRVTVANDGVTGTPKTGGFGVRGLQERARHAGGTLASAPDGPGRWMLRAELPLAPTHQEDEA